MSIRSREKRARRKFKQHSRHVSSTGGLFLIGQAYLRGEDAQLLGDEQVTNISLCTWIAFNNLVTGQSTGDDWGIVTSALNTAMVLSEHGYGVEHEQVFVRAQDGAFRALLRNKQTDVWRFDGQAIQDIRTALELHDQQCAITSKADIKFALETVQNRIKSGVVYDAVPT